MNDDTIFSLVKTASIQFLDIINNDATLNIYAFNTDYTKLDSNGNLKT